MIVCVTSTGTDLNAPVDPRFGRCGYFIFIDTETLEYDAVSNNAAGTAGGAGIQSASLISDRGASAVITGNFGPNATTTLQAAGVKMIVGAQGVTVKEALQGFKDGKYREVNSPSVESHYGMGAGAGRGMGQGSGQGMGRGMGQGMGTYTDFGPVSARDSSREQGPENARTLKEQAMRLEQELNAVKEKIDTLESTGTSQEKVVVDKDQCIGCRVCEDICPQNAITVKEVAEVDHERCTLCGKCVN